MLKVKGIHSITSLNPTKRWEDVLQISFTCVKSISLRAELWFTRLALTGRSPGGLMGLEDRQHLTVSNTQTGRHPSGRLTYQHPDPLLEPWSTEPWWPCSHRHRRCSGQTKTPAGYHSRPPGSDGCWIGRIGHPRRWPWQ